MCYLFKADPDHVDFGEYGDEDESPRVISENEDPVDAVGHAIHQQPHHDKMIHME